MALTEEPAQLDWVHLPDGVEAISLWESLHDGEICAIKSDQLGRAVRIEFGVLYLLTFHKLAESLRFCFQFEGVQSVRVARWVAWPGAFAIPPGTPREHEARLVAEYQAEGRVESESWSAFEATLAASSDGGPEIASAHLAVGGGARGVALQLGVRVDHSFYDIFLGAERLELSRSDGRQLSLQEFRQLGSAYWEAFSKRQPHAG